MKLSNKKNFTTTNLLPLLVLGTLFCLSVNPVNARRSDRKRSSSLLEKFPKLHHHDPSFFQDWTLNDVSSYLKDHVPELSTPEFLSKHSLDDLKQKAYEVWTAGADVVYDTSKDLEDDAQEFVDNSKEKIFEIFEPQPWYKKYNPFVKDNWGTSLQKKQAQYQKDLHKIVTNGVSSASSMGERGVSSASSMGERGVSSASSLGKEGLSTASSLATKGVSSASSLGSSVGKEGLSTASSLATKGASSASSLGKEGMSSASSLGKVGASSLSSLGKDASSSASSLATKGVSKASSLGKEGLSSASSLGHVGASSASSLGQVGASSASSLGQVGASSASSLGQVGASSASSLGQVGASSASSLGQVGASSASSLGQAGASSAASLASDQYKSVKTYAGDMYDVANQKTSDISNWFFNTWSSADLMKILQENGVKVADQASQSKDDLVKLCKDNFKQISKNLQNSGKYISESYFESWDLDNLKDWLRENNIKFKDSSKTTRDDLLKLVKKNIYKVSNKYDSTKYDLLNSLNLDSMDVFSDKIENPFEKWSVADLQKWFKIHGIEWKHSKNGNAQDAYTEAIKHKNLLHQDGEWYLQKTQELAEKNGNQANKLMTKSKNQVVGAFSNIYDSLKGWVSWNKKQGASAIGKAQDKIGSVTDNRDNITNDTFLINVENWPIQKMRSFLDAREIHYSLNAPKKDLIALVQNNRNRKLVNLKAKTIEDKGIFDRWSVDNLQRWIQHYKFKTKSKINHEPTVFEKANAKLSDIVSNTHNDLNNLWDTTFKDWSVTDLKEYVSSFGYKTNDNMSKDELLNVAKENTLWFLSGGNYERTKDKSYFQRTKDYVYGAMRQIPFVNS
ncbi:hypothetical protein ACO0RG_002985 [Hanseniaspora osmophila]